ncbi:MAG: hypothetical protein DRQ62_02500 [Gammaproteobacteria bacterium]|nr:MAG: hypothetical protein DRQ62_02500 [Gammaproteobacteria bacterium]
MYKLLLFISIFLVALNAQAQPAAPVLHVDSEGLQLALHWSKVDNALGYRLLYASYPYNSGDTIHSIDMSTETHFSIGLWQGAAFYVAVQAYDTQQQSSGFSNIGFFQIQDRGANYRQYWRTVAKEISDKTFTSNKFLYDTLPDIDSCFSGTLGEQAQLRQLEAFNQTRLLHKLSTITYASDTDFEVQESALIQRANNFLSHTPSMNATCYSDAGFDGSSSSNLHLGSANSDPAEDMFGLVNDAYNLSNIASVGHRRAFLNPFLQFTSYGQVFGASAVKVFDFVDSSSTAAEQIPDYVALPYLRYPYVFFSDKTDHKKTPWNLTIVEDKSSIWANQHKYFAVAKLSVTRKDNAQQMLIENRHTDTRGSGVPNNLSWSVKDWQYDTWYTVKISNIKYRSGQTGSIQYDVFIDYKKLIDITSPLEDADQQNGSVMQGTLFEQNDKDSFEIDLQGPVTFSGSSQFSNMAFFIAVYGPDKQLIQASDQTFMLDLPAGKYTLLISNCKSNFCYMQSKKYTVRVN